MLRQLMLALVLAVLPLAARAEPPPYADDWNGAQIAWRDVRSGIYEAASSGKTAIMVFHAPWCVACRQYRAVFNDPGVVAASKNFVMMLIDADADKSTNGAFSPDGTYVPRTLFINSEGDVLSKYVGKDQQFPHSIDIKSPDELRALMQRAVDDAAPSSGATAPPEPTKISN